MRENGSDYRGLWQRLVLSRPGEPVDTLTQVGWIQGPSLFVDLRQPPAIARAITARCLDELSIEEAHLLAAQEGFAGRIAARGDEIDREIEWLRAIDWQAPAPLADRGRIEDHGDLLVEHGIEADYIEHWQREPGTQAQNWAAVLHDEGFRRVILVRCGNRFGYARERGASLAKGEDLRERLASDDIGALLDCEIALGTIGPAGWRIDRSTLPWRQGMLLLKSGVGFADGILMIADNDAQGRPIVRHLTAIEVEGTPAFDVMPMPAPVAARESAIPVIDIAALGGPDAAAEAETVAALRRAAEEVGFLHVTGHGIAPAVIARLRARTETFFALPEAIKRASHIGHSSNHRGYVPEGEEVFAAGQRDRKEAFDLALDLAGDSVPAGHPMLGPNQWPDVPGFREDVMAYYAATFAVGRRLLRGFALALGQPAQAFDALVTRPPSQLRLIHYPHVPGIEDVPGIGAHTDYECFTLLLADQPGLEVMNGAGAWIDAPPVPGALVVNIGDMMEFWSGGRFVATSHRVRKVAQERYSFPLFFALDYDVELAPLGRGARPIRTGEHLYAETVRTFRYLQERAARGEIVPPAAQAMTDFGREARARQPLPAAAR